MQTWTTFSVWLVHQKPRLPHVCSNIPACGLTASSQRILTRSKHQKRIAILRAQRPNTKEASLSSWQNTPVRLKHCLPSSTTSQYDGSIAVVRAQRPSTTDQRKHGSIAVVRAQFPTTTEILRSSGQIIKVCEMNHGHRSL